MVQDVGGNAEGCTYVGTGDAFYSVCCEPKIALNSLL